MKKSRNIIVAFLAIISLASCKEDFTCNCSFYNSGEVKFYDTTYNKMRENDAIYYCDQLAADFAWKLANGQTNDTIVGCNLNKIK